VNVVNILGKVLPDGTLLETVYDPATEEGRLLVVRPGDLPRTASTHTCNGTEYRPLIDASVKQGLVLLPSAELEPPEAAEMVEEITHFLGSYLDLDPGFRALAARFATFTWIADRHDKTPFIRFLGEYGTGKSRALNVLAAICRHSVMLGVAATSAGVFRTNDKYGGTLFFDEADLPKAMHHYTIIPVLKAGYERNGVVTRCQGADYEPRIYKVYGPKVFAAHAPSEDPALESRILSHNCFVTEDTSLLTPLPAFSEWHEAIRLRNMLLGFRLRSRSAPTEREEASGVDAYEPRMQEILWPLFGIAGDREIPADVAAYLHALVEQRAAWTASAEGSVVAAAFKQLEAEGRQFTVGEVASLAGSLRPHGPPITAKAAGQHLRSRGQRPTRRGSGYTFRPRIQIPGTSGPRAGTRTR
jgi:hypothetical protein